MKKTSPRGYLMLLTLIFGAIFLTVLGALATFALTQNRVQVQTEGKAKALGLAEAGLEYYRWFLSHNPDNAATLTNGTGQPGPYILTYNDPEAGLVGTVSLDVSGSQSCGQTSAVNISSTGAPNDGTNAKRTVTARYARPSVARYSFLLNDNVWAGPDRIINGPYHSNGAVEMDGTANSGVSSALTTWTCISGFGCSSGSQQAGVFGSGPNSSLWKTGVPTKDFAGFKSKFSTHKAIAQSNGLYFPRISTGTGTPASNGAVPGYWNGYHLTFNSNGTVSVRQVTSTVNIAIPNSSYLSNPTDPLTDHTVINTESGPTVYTIPSTCGLIFVEDNVWIEGTVPSKVTVSTANTGTGGILTSATLRGNIAYTGTSTGLTVISQNNILISGDSPQTMSLKGVFVATGGAFGRNFLGCPSVYEPRTSLTIQGSTVSFKRTGTKWTGGAAGSCSGNAAGYASRVDTVDSVLANDPPVFTPTTDDDYEFVYWREK